MEVERQCAGDEREFRTFTSIAVPPLSYPSTARWRERREKTAGLVRDFDVVSGGVKLVLLEMR